MLIRDGACRYADTPPTRDRCARSRVSAAGSPSGQAAGLAVVVVGVAVSAAVVSAALAAVLGAALVVALVVASGDSPGLLPRDRTSGDGCLSAAMNERR